MSPDEDLRFIVLITDTRRFKRCVIIIIIIASAVNFVSEVGRRLTSLSGDPRETSFLFQRLSMLIQRFNSALITDSFCFADEDPDL